MGVGRGKEVSFPLLFSILLFIVRFCHPALAQYLRCGQNTFRMGLTILISKAKPESSNISWRIFILLMCKPSIILMRFPDGDETPCLPRGLKCSKAPKGMFLKEATGSPVQTNPMRLTEMKTLGAQFHQGASESQRSGEGQVQSPQAPARDHSRIAGICRDPVPVL